MLQNFSLALLLIAKIQFSFDKEEDDAEFIIRFHLHNIAYISHKLFVKHSP
jgi:hypothetical protein